MATAEVQSPEATCVEFDLVDPSEVSDGARTWCVRAANFVVGFSRVEAGAVLARETQVDEYFVLFVDAGGHVTSAQGEVECGPDTLVIVPPGRSSVVATQGGQIVRVFSRHADDLAARSANAASYETRPSGVWDVDLRTPAAGPRLLTYQLESPGQPGGRSRVFRSANLMMNVFTERTERRDATALTPHWHDHFEQGSLALSGRWVHHLRYPWVPDLKTWREDQHVACGSPSLTIIPAGVEHTSQDIGSGVSRLVDIFSPPRADFMREQGKVLNSRDYPLFE